MAHKDICIKFEVEGRNYEAVGFLEENESSVDGVEMLKRTGGIIGDEDQVIIWKCPRHKLPQELKKYFFFTNRQGLDYAAEIPGHPGFTAYKLIQDIAWEANKMTSVFLVTRRVQ